MRHERGPQPADGSEECNFTESIRQESDGSGNVLRHHYLKIGSRTVARVSMRDMESGTGAGVVARPPSSTAGERPIRTILTLALFSLIAFLALRRGSKVRGIRGSLAENRKGRETASRPLRNHVPNSLQNT